MQCDEIFFSSHSPNHRLSYKNSPKNLDPGNLHLKLFHDTLELSRIFSKRKNAAKVDAFYPVWIDLKIIFSQKFKGHRGIIFLTKSFLWRELFSKMDKQLWLLFVCLKRGLEIYLSTQLRQIVSIDTLVVYQVIHVQVARGETPHAQPDTATHVHWVPITTQAKTPC